MGLRRRASSFNTSRIDHLYQIRMRLEDGSSPQLNLHYGDLTDSTNLIRIIQQVQPDEIYNLGAQSHVAVSFESPEYTANSDALGTLRVLEAVRILELTTKTRIYQASTSELYGLVQRFPKRNNAFLPLEVLTVLPNFTHIGLRLIIAKVTECMHVMACFLTMQSPRRGETFVTERSPVVYRGWMLAWKIAFLLETSTHCAIGAMLATM